MQYRHFQCFWSKQKHDVYNFTGLTIPPPMVGGIMQCCELPICLSVLCLYLNYSAVVITESSQETPCWKSNQLEVAKTAMKLSQARLQKNSLVGTICQAGVVRQHWLGQLSCPTTAVWSADLEHLHSRPMSPSNCHMWGSYCFATIRVIPCYYYCTSVVSQIWCFLCTCSVPLQEIPSYNDKRRRHSLLVQPSPSGMLQRCHSNVQSYYNRTKMLSCIKSGSATLTGAGCMPRRHDVTLRDMFSTTTRGLVGSETARRRHYDTDSLQSLSVSSSSSLSGQFLQSFYTHRQTYV